MYKKFLKIPWKFFSNLLVIYIHIKKEGSETLFFISKGEIRTLDLTGMSRALSPAELPCHNSFIQF